MGSEVSDCYAGYREEAVYLRALEPDAGGKMPQVGLENVERPCVFVYLHSAFPYVERILSWLCDRALVTAYIGGRDNSKIVNQFRTMCNEVHCISDQLLDIKACLDQSDFVVCHGGQSTVNSASKKGLPVLAVPTHTEQRSTAALLEKQNLGKCIGPARDWQLLEDDLLHGFQALDRYRAELAKLDLSAANTISLETFVMDKLRL